jgi:branched-chain amino acid transport system substrate-binding protein
MNVVSAKAIAAVAVGCFLGTLFAERPAVAADAVKLGVIMPLTGGQAPFGIASQRGIELAAERINEAGGIKSLGGARLEIVVADAASDPTTAASGAQRIISRDRVSAIICCFASSLTLAASEVAERSKVPMLGMSNTDLLTERGFKNWFQITARGSVYGAAQFDQSVEIAKAAGASVKKIAILYEDTAFGTSLAQGIYDRAKSSGIAVALFEAYPQGINDVNPLVQKVKATNADLVFPVSYFSDAVLLVRSLRQNGINAPVVGGAAGYVIPEFKAALGELSEGVLSINYSNYDNYGELGDAYYARFKQFMTHEAFEHAALVYVVAAALEKSASSKPEQIAEALRANEVTSYPVDRMPGGGVKFDTTGLNVRAHPIMVQWQKGELATVWPKVDAKAPAAWR